jgi:hypothetical protein
MALRDAQVIDYVEASSTALAQASDTIEKQAAQKRACDELIPAVVDALAEHGRIEQHEKAAAAEVLADPVKALQLLIKVAGHRSDAEQLSLGKPNDGVVKKAAFDDVTSSPFAGGRRTNNTLADAKLFSGLGLDLPANV